VFHSHCSGLPLQAEIDEFTYKALFLDIGLMNRICGLDWLAIFKLVELYAGWVIVSRSTIYCRNRENNLQKVLKKY